MTTTLFTQNRVPIATATGEKTILSGWGRPALLAAITLLASGLLPGAGAVHAQQAEPVPVVQMVNINTADAAALAAALNGVGTSRAEEIVRYREAYGPFKSVEELADVKGIGPSTLEKNRALITLD